MRLRSSAVVSEPTQIQNFLFLERMMARRTRRARILALPPNETNVSLSRCQETKAQDFASTTSPNRILREFRDSRGCSILTLAEAVLDAAISWRDYGLGTRQETCQFFATSKDSGGIPERE
jgi:hypothetical protein